MDEIEESLINVIIKLNIFTLKEIIKNFRRAFKWKKDKWKIRIKKVKLKWGRKKVEDKMLNYKYYFMLCLLFCNAFFSNNFNIL